MTLEHNTEETEEQPDSGVIKAFRKQVKALTAEVKELAAANFDAKSEARRELETEAELRKHGFSGEQVRDLVLDQIGDREIDPEIVAEAMAKVGLGEPRPTEEPGTEAPTSTPVPETVNAALAEVSGLSSAVQAAAQNIPVDGLADKIAGADTPEELAAVMAEAGQ